MGQSRFMVAAGTAALREAWAALGAVRPIVTRLVFLALAAAAASTCRSPSGVLPPSGAVPFSAPHVYASWWSMVESCSGRSAPFEAVRWYVMPGAHSFSYGTMRVAGLWTRSGNTITVGEHAQMNGQLVRHEMLHAILQYGAHPRAQYLGSCGGVVTCGENCLKDAGPPLAPAAGTPLVTPATLALDLEITPRVPSGHHDDGWFSIAVKATNPRGTPVLVDLPLAADGSARRSFAFEISGPFTAYRRTVRDPGADAMYFTGGETKRYVFDLQLAAEGNPTGVQPGSYSLRAGFGERWSGWRTVVVGP